MSVSLKNLAEQIAPLEKQYRAVLALGDALREIGNIEQVEQEARNRAQKMTKVASELEAELVRLTASLNEAEGLSAQAVKLADKIIADARVEAKYKADEVLAKAEYDKTVIAEAVTVLRANAEGEKKDLLEVRRQIVEAQAELQAAKDEFAQLRRVAATIAGQ